MSQNLFSVLFLKALVLAILFFTLQTTSAAQPAVESSTEAPTRYQWIHPQQCEPKSFTPLPGQRPPGLMAFSVVCADGTKKTLSANVIVMSKGYKLNKTYKKGEKISKEDLEPTQIEVKSSFLMPATEDDILNQTLRKNLLAGSIVRNQDLAPEKAWESRETVPLMFRSQSIEAKAAGIAVRDGYFGQKAKASLNNKTIEGIVKRDEQGKPFLEVTGAP